MMYRYVLLLLALAGADAANGGAVSDMNMHPRTMPMNNDTGMDKGSVNSSGSTVMVSIQLKNYIDPGLQLPGGMTCICPDGFTCNYLGTTIASCFMSFTLILSSPDTSVKYISTEFVPMTFGGTINFDGMTPQQKNNWSQLYTFYLTSKPSAIDVFVHHMGVVINRQTGELAQMQSVVHVDTFILPLNDVIPTIGTSSQASQTVTLNGIILQTQLSLSYSVQCTGALIGTNCDLKCTPSSSSSSKAVCASNITGFFYLCDYMGPGQVQNCLNCPWGISSDSVCRQSSGGQNGQIVAPGLVPSGFRTATIILGLVLGIILIFTAVAIISLCFKQKRDVNAGAAQQNPPGHNYRSTVRADGSANRPLLQAVNNSAMNHPAPIPLPRSVPSLDAIPAKSSLRKTNNVPAAHLGGGSSLNDTLNSTLSSVPLPPSKEADV